MSDEILTLEEAAALLKIGPDVINDLFVCGEIPGRKIGGQWRTTKRALINYIDCIPYGSECCCAPNETENQMSSNDNTNQDNKGCCC